MHPELAYDRGAMVQNRVQRHPMRARGLVVVASVADHGKDAEFKRREQPSE